MDAVRRAPLFILILHMSQCWCLAEFDMFPGFENDDTTTISAERETTMTTSKISTTSSVMTTDITRKPNITETVHKKKLKRQTTSETITARPDTTTTQVPFFTNTIPYKPQVCPEEERPSNIGPYEVPTQRDLAIHMKITLRSTFNSYHKKALFFLNDIKEATKATSQIERKCPSISRLIYKQCVKHVSNQCQMITKSLVTSLERQRHDVSAFTEASVCNFASLKADPVQLIKILAMEEASLEFALPGFLRLLSACARYCRIDNGTVYRHKPTRHMTDQDLVIKHFLTRKNYVQLLKENP